MTLEPSQSSGVRIVISGSYGTPNVGDEAILEALLDGLTSSLCEPNIAVLTFTPNETRLAHPQVEAIQSNVFRGFLCTWRAIKKADLLIIGGGGIIQDSSSFGNLFFHLSRPAIAVLTRTPFVGCGLGVGPIKRRLGRILTLLLMKRATHIWVRDRKSASTLQKIGIENRQVTVTGDLVFTLSRTARENAKSPEIATSIEQTTRRIIGLSIRPEPGKHRKLRYRSEQYTEFLRSVVTTMIGLIKEYDAHILFVSMHPNQDDHIGEDIKNMVGLADRVTVLSGALRPKEILAVMRNLDMMIGMRLHSLIFAARANVPMVGIAYDPKVNELMESLDMSQFILNVNELNSSVMLEMCRKVIRTSDEIKNHLRERLVSVESRSAHNVYGVVNLLSRNESSQKSVKISDHA